MLSYFETFLAMFLSPCMVSPVRDNWCSLKGVILEWSFVQELFPIQYARKMTWLCAFIGLGINILSFFLNSLRFVLKTTHKNKNLLGWLTLGYRHWNVLVKSSANPLLQTHYLRPVRWRLCVCIVWLILCCLFTFSSKFPLHRYFPEVHGFFFFSLFSLVSLPLLPLPPFFLPPPLLPPHPPLPPPPSLCPSI